MNSPSEPFDFAGAFDSSVLRQERRQATQQLLGVYSRLLENKRRLIIGNFRSGTLLLTILAWSGVSRLEDKSASKVKLLSSDGKVEEEMRKNDLERLFW